MVKRLSLALMLILAVDGIIGPGPVEPPVDPTAPHRSAVAAVAMAGSIEKGFM